MRIIVNGAWRETEGAELSAVLEELGYPTGVKQHPLRIVKKCYHRLVEAYRFRLAPPPPPLSMPVRDLAGVGR